MSGQFSPVFHPALASGYLRPQLPEAPPGPPPASPVRASPQVTPSDPMRNPAVAALQGANFDLQTKLEKAVEKIKKFDSERNELLDRLEKALLTAARLKDIANERDEYLEKFQRAEEALRDLSKRNEIHETLLNERERELNSVRGKYFSERKSNDQLVTELKLVSSASDLAKREIDNHLSRLSLREVQLSTARNLQGTSVDDELNMAAALYDNAMHRTNPFGGMMSDGGANPVFDLPEKSVWNSAKMAIVDMNVPEYVRTFMLTSSRGTIHSDGFMRMDCAIVIDDAETARIQFSATNISSAIIKDVRVVPTGNRAHLGKYYVMEVQGDKAVSSFLRPGQCMKLEVEFSVRGAYSPTVLPKVCLSYVNPDGLPKSSYVDVPVVHTRFISPLSPSVSALTEKWKEYAQNEVQYVMTVTRDELKTFSTITNLGELGGSLRYQRGVDPNPRGALFAGAWGAGKHGNLQEVISRVELSPSSWAGPTKCRVTVRSPTNALSDSIARSLLMSLV
jgi:hypothetical protein